MPSDTARAGAGSNHLPYYFPTEGVALHRNSYCHFALLTGRLFDGEMRLLFFQGKGSKCRCQVNAAGFFFRSIFHRAPVPAHQSLMGCFISLPCCLSAFLAPPCSPKLLLASQSSGTPRWWYWSSLSADAENPAGSSARVQQSRRSCFPALA